MKSRNQQILEFIKEYKDEHEVSPSNAEIKEKFKLSSSSVVHYALDALEEYKCIKREPKKARAIKVLGLNYDELLNAEDKLCRPLLEWLLSRKTH